MRCSWHNNCLYGPDGGAALDWNPANPSSTTVWTRLIGAGPTTSATWVGRAESFYSTYPCKQVQTNIMRISDWAVFGYVHAYHSWGNANPSYFNIYASQSGVQNAHVGGYILPWQQDNCSSTGNHTHQFYESGPNDTWCSKNTSIPWCDECYTPYPVWSTHEYLIQWNSYRPSLTRGGAPGVRRRNFCRGC